MKSEGIIGPGTKVYRSCVWIMRIAYVNLLWNFFMLLGLIVLGFIPSTISMFTIVRKWIRGEHDFPITKTFWNTFKNEFIKSNVVGGAFFLIDCLLYLDIYILKQQATANLIHYYFVVILFLITTVCLFFFFPIYVHYRLKKNEYFRQTILITLISPIEVFLIIAGCSLVYVVLLKIPGLIPLFSGILFTFIIIFSANRSFDRIEKKLSTGA